MSLSAITRAGTTVGISLRQYVGIEARRRHSLVAFQKLCRQRQMLPRQARREDAAVELSFANRTEGRALARALSERERERKEKAFNHRPFRLPKNKMETTTTKTHLEGKVLKRMRDARLALVPAAGLDEEGDGRGRLAVVRRGHFYASGVHDSRKAPHGPAPCSPCRCQHFRGVYTCEVEG